MKFTKFRDKPFSITQNDKWSWKFYQTNKESGDSSLKNENGPKDMQRKLQTHYSSCN